MFTKLTPEELSEAQAYADNASTQLRKGLLTFCVLKVCNHDPVYSSDIIKRLRAAELIVVEGTMYPLLSRLQKDGLLTHVWKESEQGPPRKYYQTTGLGAAVADKIAAHIESINKTLSQL